MHPHLTGEAIFIHFNTPPLIKYSARICDKDGHFISPTTTPPTREPLDATPQNPFHPFEDRLAFEFADYHFSQQQSSGSAIDRALQLWAAQSAKNGHDDVPWKSVEEMYKTIDQIQQGNDPWKSVSFRYQGQLPQDPPKWMTESFILVTHSIRSLIHEQIACPDFHSHWDYVPFMQFNDTGDRVWTSLMSGDWAAKEAVRVSFSPALQILIDQQDKISNDPSTHGAMFVSIVAGSDKTVASVATGHQEFHPVYIGPGNIDNPTRRSHGIGILPCAFLPIPKGMVLGLCAVHRC